MGHLQSHFLTCERHEALMSHWTLAFSSVLWKDGTVPCLKQVIVSSSVCTSSKAVMQHFVLLPHGALDSLYLPHIR